MLEIFEFLIFITLAVLLLLVVGPLLIRVLHVIALGTGAPRGKALLRGARPALPAPPARSAETPPQPVVPAPEAGPVPATEGLRQAPDGAAAEETIDISAIEGRVRTSSVKRITEIVEKHPEEAVAIVRNWLHEGR